MGQEVRSFGESHPDVKDNRVCWIEFSNGKVSECNEDVIMALWGDWIQNVNNNSYRADDDDFTIFAYKTPVIVEWL